MDYGIYDECAGGRVDWHDVLLGISGGESEERHQFNTPSMTLGGSSRSVSSPLAYGSEKVGEIVFSDSLDFDELGQPSQEWNQLSYSDVYSQPDFLSSGYSKYQPGRFTLHNSISLSHDPNYHYHTLRYSQIHPAESHADHILGQHREVLDEVDDNDERIVNHSERHVVEYGHVGDDEHEGGRRNGQDEDGNEDEDEDEEDGEDEWSGQDHSLELTVIRALEGDFSLAAHMIPILHKSVFTKMSTTVTQKVGPWRHGVFPSSHGFASTESEQAASSYSHRGDSTSNYHRKRQRTGDSSTRIGDEIYQDESDGGRDESDDGRQNPKQRRCSPASAAAPLLPRLACPLYKRNPVKYSAQGSTNSKPTTTYRACAGPGFNSIQRLKEHLKRKHYPVQCERCYEIFKGADRSACVRALQAHRQLPDPCQLKPSSLKEGISDAQWAALEKKKGKTKDAESSRVEKWFEIWTVLFPTIDPPSTPWYENESYNRSPPPPSREGSAFAELFSAMLDHQVKQRHIRLSEGSEDVMKSRIETLVQKAFDVYVAINGPPASTNSSSSRSQIQGRSLLGSSIQPSSTFGTTPSRHNPSSTGSTGPSVPRSQAQPLDITTSNEGPSRMDMAPPANYPSIYRATVPRPNTDTASIDFFSRSKHNEFDGKALPSKVGESVMDLHAHLERQKSI